MTDDTRLDHLAHIERNTILILKNRQYLFSGDEALALAAMEINRELCEANFRRWREVQNG